MKTTAIAILATLVATSSVQAAKTSFVCKHKADFDSSYIFKTMMVTLDTTKETLFAKPIMDDGTAFDGDTGKKYKINKETKWVTFKGYDSDLMFGDCSEGYASSILVYVSPEMMKGKPGKLALWASGPEVGLEKGVYSCSLKK